MIFLSESNTPMSYEGRGLFYHTRGARRISSLYMLLELKYNLIAVNAYETLEATTASALEAQLLEIKRGVPAVGRKNRVVSEPVTYGVVRILYRADRYKYFAHLTRRES